MNTLSCIKREAMYSVVQLLLLLLLLGAHRICFGCSAVIHLKCQVTHSTYHKMKVFSILLAMISCKLNLKDLFDIVIMQFDVQPVAYAWNVDARAIQNRATRCFKMYVT